MIKSPSIYVPPDIVSELKSFFFMNRTRRSVPHIDVPVVFCFEGPSGVGKTTTYKAVTAHRE